MDTSLLEMRYMPIGSNMYDVITKEEYAMAPNLYATGNVAILNGPYVLPIRNDLSQVGINMSAGLVCPFNPPKTDEEKDIYSSEHMIDMSNPKSYGEIIERTHAMRDVEREMLMNVDNVTTPSISPNDAPAMSGLKEAITLKHCDIDKYSDRFGSNFANEKRLLKDSEISLKKLIIYGNAMDIKMTLTMEDASSDVPNPMGEKVTVVLTGGNKYGEEES